MEIIRIQSILRDQSIPSLDGIRVLKSGIPHMQSGEILLYYNIFDASVLDVMSTSLKIWTAVFC